MRIYLFTSLALLIIISSVSKAAEFFEPISPPRRFQVMAHRGAMSDAPENTRPALDRCVDLRIEWAEVDVRLTKDGQHIVFHDSTVDGKTDGTGAVSDLTLAEIKLLDAGSHFSDQFKGERILTLKECLTIARNRLNLYLDCKSIDPELIVHEILDADMANQVVVFDSVEVLEKVRLLSKGQIPIMPKWHTDYGIEDWVAKWKPSAVEINHNEVTPDVCARFHALGIKVQAKVLDEADIPAVWTRMLECGVDWLQTDRAPELLRLHESPDR
ncbi:MAG: glycerophosphoryl diester phosphodiesterase [Candidatus Hydrogenedentota bacterium]